ncbi:MAG: hypothetical protein FJ206_01140 [Gemmatimonadetes bacterium]|nr:hypothetical protein [Gemmatimonadota bacterium]
MLRSLVASGLLAAVVVVTSAHVGSPDTWFQGQAGPYPVRVVIRLPGVVPGLAQIDISVTGDGVREVTAQPVIFDAGKEGAPPPDVAKPVHGRPGSYHAELWFMTVGSFSVNVAVDGSQGSGSVVVPVAAVAVRQIALYPWLGKLLAVLGLFLFVGAVTIFRAAATDGVTPPGLSVERRQARRGLVVASVGAGLLSAGLWGGRSWWNSVAADYRSALYRPFAAAAAVETRDGAPSLRFTITDSIWTGGRAANRWQRFSTTPLVPDHGKLMHLFMIRKGDQGAFAHLHPVSTDSANFYASVAGLPAGRYDVYADVVHETGFPQTMVAEVELPAAVPGAPGDPDDAVFVGDPAEDSYRLPDGATITWVNRPAELVANQEAGLDFVVREIDGSEARLAPFLGMPAHAVVHRDDGSVYIHLHPNGTISMAAQAALLSRQVSAAAPVGAADPHAAHGGEPMFAGRVGFPYAFPKGGNYRVWVQIRRGGVILTAPFAVTVRD